MTCRYLWVVERCDKDVSGEYFADLMEIWNTRELAREAKNKLDVQFPQDKHRVTAYLSVRYLMGYNN